MKVLYYCEKCGKPVYNKFGSGRFCSRACANSRIQTDEINEKRSITLKNTKKSRTCSVCGKQIRKNNISGMCFNCYKASGTARKVASENWKHRKVVIGWRPRNIKSYPEKFWEKILNNNFINYEGPNVPVKKQNGINNYFLDFLIDTNGHKIDLEIDGKQHTYPDRVESDKNRDNYLKSIGYEVYRVPWNEINSEEGSKLMKQKIDDFINFYKSCL